MILVAMVAPEARTIVLRRSDLVDWHGPLDDCSFARHPTIVSQLDDVLQHESYACRQFTVVGQLGHPLKVLVHQPFALVRVQDAAAGPHDLAEALQVLVVPCKQLLHQKHSL